MRPAGMVSGGRKPEFRLIFMATALRDAPRMRLTTNDRRVMVSDSDGIGSASKARSVEIPSWGSLTCSIVGDRLVAFDGTISFNYLFDSVCMSWLKPRHTHRIKCSMQLERRGEKAFIGSMVVN